MIDNIYESLSHLDQLLRGLPTTLPFNPSPSPFPVTLDQKSLNEEGYGVALNSVLHSSFGHQGVGLKIEEQGTNIQSVSAVIRQAVDAASSDDEKTLIQLWINDISKAALSAGAELVSEEPEIVEIFTEQGNRLMRKRERDEEQLGTASGNLKGKKVSSLMVCVMQVHH